MSTPAISVLIGSSRVVVSRAQPPLRTRLCDKANGHLRFGIVPASVYGETRRLGFSRSTGTLRGPRIVAPSSPRIGCGTPSSGCAPGCPVVCCDIRSLLSFLYSSFVYLRPSIGRVADLLQVLQVNPN